jgi:hypothetical protein
MKTAKLTRKTQKAVLRVQHSQDAAKASKTKKSSHNDLGSKVIRMPKDEQEASDDTPAERKGKSASGAKQHQQDLSELEKTDPEFYKFLQENDSGLLDFEPNNDEDEEEDEVDKIVRRLADSENMC